MPELPEVETVRLSIQKNLIGSVITAIDIHQRKLRQKIPLNFKQKLLKQKIFAVHRRGKYLLISTSYGIIIIHLGMSGRLLVKDITPKRTKHEHVTMTLSNGKLLSLIDPRRFGLVLWIKTLNHPVLKKLGKEPLTKDFSHDYLYNAAQKRKITIKQLIMDNRIVAGIGNIYASEALFAAKIYPLTPANKLNSKQCQILVTKIKSILKSAIKNRGTTFRDYVDGSGMSGNFQKYLKVYGRENQPCKSCRTKLQNIKIGQRNTIYCLKCQNQGNESQPSL